MREITYTPEARKTLKRIPANVAQRIRDKVEQYVADPASLANNVKTMRGLHYTRLRVGDWRVVMDEQDVVVIIVRVGPRGGVYG